MKSVVVIDTPENCRRCPFRQSPWSFCLGEYEKEKHCPLRPLPSFKAVDLNDSRDVVMFCHGWNTLLAEITGETE